MNGAVRRSGSAMVAVAVAATVTAVGVGTIYLPFIADKDHIRGLHEEGEISAADRREYERVLSQIGGQNPSPNRKPSRPMSNSMWQRMNDAASQKKQP